MQDISSRQKFQSQVLQNLIAHLREEFDIPLFVQLWDGTRVPLGQNADPQLCIAFSSPGVIASLLRRPTLDNLVRHYALKHIDLQGADVQTLITRLRTEQFRAKVGNLNKSLLIKSLIPFLFAPAESTSLEHGYQGDESGRKRKQGENKDFIQFHYDVSNEFYELFLDPEMVYSCGYFTDWSNTLEQAQHDKLDITCRKLRLTPGERFLDIGCGWGALICHAARNYGVKAHGITLSERQYEYTLEKIQRLGLQDRVTVEILDYAHLDGCWDKVASIGMVEHVGIDNMRKYMQTVSRILPDRGMFLCHGITRRAKRSQKRFRRMSAEQRLLAKYIFPGGELDHIGHMVEMMESCRFEVHDVEGWRDHYALTCRHWSQRLTRNADAAIREVGEERYRIWVMYLSAVSMALADGSAYIYQTLATKHRSRGISGMPPTRAHLYEPRNELDADAA